MAARGPTGGGGSSEFQMNLRSVTFAGDVYF